jgi:hypothetical protein
VTWAGTLTMPNGIAEAVPLNFTVHYDNDGIRPAGASTGQIKQGMAAAEWTYDRSNNGHRCSPESDACELFLFPCRSTAPVVFFVGGPPSNALCTMMGMSPALDPRQHHVLSALCFPCLDQSMNCAHPDPPAFRPTLLGVGWAEVDRGC